MSRHRQRTVSENKNSRPPDHKPSGPSNGARPRQPERPQRTNHPNPPPYRVSTPHQADRGPGFVTVDLSLNNIGSPSPSGPCPHGHLEQAVSLIIHRRSPIRCPICGGVPVFITQTDQYPLSVLELRTPPNELVHVHQPLGPANPQGYAECNKPPKESG